MAALIDWETASWIRSRVLAAALIPAGIVKVVIAAHETPTPTPTRPSRALRGLTRAREAQPATGR